MSWDRTYEEWARRLRHEGLTSRQAQHFCHRYVPMSLDLPFGGRGGYTDMPVWAARDLVGLVSTFQPRITSADDCERGRKWLAANAERFGFPRFDWQAISEFRFIGYHRYGNYFAPIYRALWLGGPGTFQTLDYAPMPWGRGRQTRCYYRMHPHIPRNAAA